jgi:putative ABC transport system permease protein
METVLRNLRLSLRQIRRQPGLATAVILTLGLAIGANTTVFSFVNALLLHPFPFRDSGQLVEIYSVRGGQVGRISMREMLDIQEQIPILDGISGRTAGFGGYNFSGEGKPQEWKTTLITGNLFDVLGVPLATGNKWPGIADRSRDNRVILSYGSWQSSFAGNRSVLGKKIVLDHAEGYRIDGVAQKQFDYPRGIEVYRSIGGFTAGERRDFRNLIGVARIKRPYGIARLQVELDAFGNRLVRQFPDTNAGLSFRAESFRDVYSGDVRPYLLVIFGAALFVLLIACGNVVNLLLSRALARDREVAIRTSLGASRWTLVWQLLTESTVLSISAAILGIALAYWSVKILRASIGLELPSWMSIEIDTRVLMFTIAISLLTGIISGLAPALHAATSSAEALKAGRGGTASLGKGRLRDLLIVSQIAVALVLLCGAGLLIRTFSDMQSRDRGFRADSVATFRVFLGWKRYGKQETIARYYDRALEALAATPGVEDVAIAPNPPLARQEESAPNTVQAEGQPVEEALRNPYVLRQNISEHYFSLMRIPLKAGRTFTQFDRADAEPVAIVNERLAARLWPGRDPVGQRLRYGPQSKSAYRKVVGVVGNVEQTGLSREFGLDYYIPYRQEAEANEFVLVRTHLPIRTFTAKAEQAMWNIDSEQSVFDFKTYEDRILNSVWQLRLSRTLLGLFAVVALVLASIGVYGVMSYVTVQRTREMSIRLALGATQSSIQTLVVRRAALLGAVGITIGSGGALLLATALRRLIPGVSGIDLGSLIGALTVLFAVTISAGAIPSWRVSRVDPALTLRQE